MRIEFLFDHCNALLIAAVVYIVKMLEQAEHAIKPQYMQIKNQIMHAQIQEHHSKINKS